MITSQWSVCHDSKCTKVYWPNAYEDHQNNCMKNHERNEAESPMLYEYQEDTISNAALCCLKVVTYIFSSNIKYLLWPGLLRNSMLKSVLVNKIFKTWHLIGWQGSRQPIRSRVKIPRPKLQDNFQAAYVSSTSRRRFLTRRTSKILGQ